MGLAHISEFGLEGDERLSDTIKAGEPSDFVVKSIDAAQHRINLVPAGKSKKEKKPKEEKAEVAETEEVEVKAEKKVKKSAKTEKSEAKK